MDPATVEAAASAELAVMSEADIEWRADAGRRARAILDERGQTWGAMPPRTVAGRVG
jgi:hypothetical protein